MLYLALDNSLQDCSDLPAGHAANSEIVKDYKRLASKGPSANKSRRKCLAQPERPRVLIYSRDINNRRYDEQHSEDVDWILIGLTKISEHTFVALVTLNGALCRISIQSRLNTAAPPVVGGGLTTPSPINTPDILLTNHSSDQTSSLEQTLLVNQEAELFCEVASMSEPKCGLGVAELNGKLLVVGGYDRAECLRSVESYDPSTNQWMQQLSLGEARGRVQIAVIDGIVYAVGGCNGTTELDTVECLPTGATKWKKCAKLPFSRSNAGVCAFEGKIYCIGGWNCNVAIKHCDVYMPESNTWTSMAQLNTGRYQTGVTSFKEKIFAVGGSDAWNCLGTVEVYEPERGEWSFSASLLTPRRGCGLAEFNKKLYAVGGSDGSHSLNSTEFYDEDTKTWVVGPNLTTARSNVSVVVVQNRLYAIGGFSGKTFLNSIEYLDAESNEWTTFVAQNQQPIFIENGETREQNGVNGKNVSANNDHDDVFEPRNNLSSAVTNLKIGNCDADTNNNKNGKCYEDEDLNYAPPAILTPTNE